MWVLFVLYLSGAVIDPDIGPVVSRSYTYFSKDQCELHLNKIKTDKNVEKAYCEFREIEQ
jgi:hypothetical protein